MDTLLALGDDLTPAVQALQAPEHVLDAQLVVLHQTFHCRHLHQLAVGNALYPSKRSMVSPPAVACTEQ